MEMKIQILRLATVAAALCLTACVTPQIQKTSAPAQAVPASQSNTAPPGGNVASKVVASAAPTPGATANGTKPVETVSAVPPNSAAASKAFQGLLEKELICAVKNSRLSLELIRKTAISERVIASKPTTVDGKSVTFAVKGSLTVYGIKVTELAFDGDAESDGASMAVTLDSSMADVVKVYKDNKIKVKKSTFGPGLWNKRPNSLFTGVYQNNGKLSMVCVDPMM
jgi:hypothetical protein